MFSSIEALLCRPSDTVGAFDVSRIIKGDPIFRTTAFRTSRIRTRISQTKFYHVLFFKLNFLLKLSQFINKEAVRLSKRTSGTNSHFNVSFKKLWHSYGFELQRCENSWNRNKEQEVLVPIGIF